jgi:hypothetical protein
VKTALTVGMLAVATSAAAGPLPVPATLLQAGLQAHGARSDTLVYDNTVNASGYYMAFGSMHSSEIEDDITVAAGAPFTMTRFDVGVYYPNTGTATVNFYLDDGAGYPALPAVFTHTFDVSGDVNNVQVLSLSGLDVPLPAMFYMGLSGTGADNGWLMYSPAVLGSSQDLFWLDRGGPYWFSPPSLSSFCAAVYTPEPSGLLLLSAAVFLPLRRR